jgi:beta-lactamase regulating signal transducer with metallopeptidase domain
MTTFANIFLTLTFLFIPLSFWALVSKRWVYTSPQKILKLNTLALVLTLVLAVVASALPDTFIMDATLSESKTVTSAASLSSFVPQVHFDNGLHLSPHSNTVVNYLPVILISISFLILLSHLYRLQRYLRLSYSYKNIGSVKIKLKDNLSSPYTFSIGFMHTVVLPQWSLESPEHTQIFLKHELQHIRQGDTQMSYAIAILQWMYFWHPFFWLWKTQYEQIQEISCDCFLIGHKKINFRDYTNCLLETNQKAWRTAQAPLGMTLAFWRHKKHLLWRVKYMSEYQQKKNQKTGIHLILAAATLCALVSTAYASKGFHQRTIDKNFVTDAIEALVIGQSRIPTSIEVSKELATIMNSPEKRKFYRMGLERLKEYDKVFDDEMLKYGVPRELKAMALVESGVQNLEPQKGIFERSTGIWQIIGSTARGLGLTVNEQTDDRRDVVKSTNAAIRYLVMNRARFNNWDLSVLSYNSGELAVGDAIIKAGSKDPMEVRKHLHAETQRYYIKVIAAMIIMGNPSLVAETN